ncbi:hypothetical protein TNCT_700941 [Trichonephila clavata]|uniref:SCP domain-containing protein n=1 Tax=Trichonephila clavata TaxID=2740835 RepID=A0A8X6H263_TRICU|nr:hypothetical protein TNCT_700941 [Trichonephila clavata]
MHFNKTNAILKSETIFLEMLFFILTLSYTLTWADSEKCPDEYARLSEDHTYCLDIDPKCNIRDKDVTQDEIDHILKLHNKYRSRVALGQETKAGGLPTASDMLEMVWDEELAGIAQKWANNCLTKHDCNECREVANFPVGQNIRTSKQACYTSQCVKPSDRKHDWGKTVKSFYDEVNDYDKSWLSLFEDREEVDIGHFTQVVWAKTWRIGCGFAAFVKGKTYTKFYVCNYGPAGNIEDAPVYEQGKPGSACPINSCVRGETCTGGKDYPGLCKMLDPDTAPIYERYLKDSLFFCDSSTETEDCAAAVDGTSNWIFTRNLQGM